MSHSIQTDYRSILRLALPISAGTFMQFLVVLTDNYFLSRTSDVALNGAGNAGILYVTVAMLGAGFCNTGQILIARRTGEGHPDAALSLLRTGLQSMLLAGFAMVLLVWAMMEFGLSGIFKDAQTAAIFNDFLHIRKWGFIPSFLVMMLNAFFMGTARSRVLMWAMITTGSVNIIGDLLLIEGHWGWPSMGAKGAALASLAAETAGLFVLLSHAVRAHGAALWAAGAVAQKVLLEWLRLALPMVAQLTLTLGTWSMFFFLVEQVGVLELKVSHIARNFFMLAFVVSQGIQQTTRTMVSTLLGEGRPTELTSVMFRLWLVNVCGIVLMAHGGLLYPEWLAAPFFDDAEGIEAAGKTLPVIFAAMLMYSASSVLLSTVQGSGHTTPALVIEASALVVYTGLAIQWTLIHPRPVWQIWWVEWAYFSLMGLGASLFLTRWDWRSKAL